MFLDGDDQFDLANNYINFHILENIGARASEPKLMLPTPSNINYSSIYIVL